MRVLRRYLMRHIKTARPVLVGAALLMVVMAAAQTQREREVLTVQGYEGQANVVRNHERMFVDVQDLARITRGSLSFEEDQIVLRLPRSHDSKTGDEANKSGFSRPF